jgi:hypothetical protein
MERQTSPLLVLTPYEARTAAAIFERLFPTDENIGRAVFPICPGVNPTLTMWALCYRAAEHLVDRLRRGDEQ